MPCWLGSHQTEVLTSSAIMCRRLCFDLAAASLPVRIMGPRGPRASPTSDQRRSNYHRRECRFQNVVGLVSECRPTNRRAGQDPYPHLPPQPDTDQAVRKKRPARRSSSMERLMARISSGARGVSSSVECLTRRSRFGYILGSVVRPAWRGPARRTIPAPER